MGNNAANIEGVKWTLFNKAAANQTIKAPEGFSARVLLLVVGQSSAGTQYAVAAVSGRVNSVVWPVTFDHDGTHGVLLDLPPGFDWTRENLDAALNLFEDAHLPPGPGSVVGHG